MLTLNIGCDEDFNNEFIGIDNLSEYSENTIDEKIKHWKQFSTNDKNYKNKFVIADANNLPFKDEVFDQIVSSRCIGRYNIKNAIKEVYRVLKMNGKVHIDSVYVKTDFFHLLIFDLMTYFINLHLRHQNWFPEDDYIDIIIETEKNRIKENK